jgi:hypothetical protein
MRKIFTISLFTLLSVFLTFSLTEKDKITLKGKVITQNRQFAELKSDNKDYVLMMPRNYLFEMKDNDSVEVQGYKIDKNAFPPNNRMGQFSGDGDLFYVTKLTVNGKTIDIEKEKDSFRNDRMGQFGRGYNRGCMRTF